MQPLLAYFGAEGPYEEGDAPHRALTRAFLSRGASGRLRSVLLTPEVAQVHESGRPRTRLDFRWMVYAPTRSRLLKMAGLEVPERRRRQRGVFVFVNPPVKVRIATRPRPAGYEFVRLVFVPGDTGKS